MVDWRCEGRPTVWLKTEAHTRIEVSERHGREARVKLAHKSRKNSLQTRRVRELARESGYRLDAAVPLSRLGSGYRVGLFLRL